MRPERLQFSLARLGIRSKVTAEQSIAFLVLKGSLGRVVTRLEYQAYSKLAIKTMQNILKAARTTASQSGHDPAVSTLIRCAVYHRLGTVPVSQPSIVIAVSSPHRKEAFRACEFILEEVKLKAQIWKREYYEGDREEDAEWKANSGS